MACEVLLEDCHSTMAFQTWNRREPEILAAFHQHAEEVNMRCFSVDWFSIVRSIPSWRNAPREQSVSPDNDLVLLTKKGMDLAQALCVGPSRTTRHIDSIKGADNLYSMCYRTTGI